MPDRNMFAGFIDPPDPGAPVTDWLEFKASMERIEPRTPDIQAYIDMADVEIAKVKSAGRPAL